MTEILYDESIDQADDTPTDGSISFGVGITHTVLEVWSNILANVEAVEKEHLPMQVASRLVNTYPGLVFQRLPEYVTMYSNCLREARDILTAVIESEPEALKRVEADGVDNHHLYLQMLVSWQQLQQEWENGWDCTAEDSAYSFAAIADAATFLLGNNGLISHLDSNKFETSEEDMASVHEILYGSEEV